jgi:hypothetical protein
MRLPCTRTTSTHALADSLLPKTKLLEPRSQLVWASNFGAARSYGTRACRKNGIAVPNTAFSFIAVTEIEEYDRKAERGGDGTVTEKAVASTSLGTALTIRACNDHYITIGIAEPNLSVSGGRVGVRFFDNFRPQPTSPLNGSVKVFDLKPQQDAMSARRCVGVDEIGVLFRVPRMPLKKQPTRVGNPIVHVAVAVVVKRVCSKQIAVPTTARPDIAHRYEWLGFDYCFSG